MGRLDSPGRLEEHRCVEIARVQLPHRFQVKERGFLLFAQLSAQEHDLDELHLGRFQNQLALADPAYALPTSCGLAA
jgi:hypothetical protein